jgi:hypothetical protein
MNADAVIAQHAADTTAGRLTGSQRMKIKVLRDIVACAALPKTNRKEAEAGLAKWEETAKAHGFYSLAAWEAVR